MALTKITGKGIGAVDEITSDTAGTSNFVAGVNAGDAIASGGNYNVCVGDEAGTAITTGDNNVAVGYNALATNTTASNNTAVGHRAGEANTTGADNVFMGKEAGLVNTTGSNNVAIGRDALVSNTTASQNTAVGYQAGNSSVTSNNNTFLGYQSGRDITGNNNTMLGSQAGQLITSAIKNTIVGLYNGNQGGLDIRTSSNNIVLSDGDGNPRQITNSSGLSHWTTNISDSDRATANDSHTIHNDKSANVALFIENSSGSPYGTFIDFSDSDPDNNTNYFIKCEGSNDTSRFFVYSDGDAYHHDGTFAQISDRRIKDNITDANSQWEDIKAMRFVNYQRKDDIRQYGESEAKVQLGLIGQELEAISPNLVRSVEPNASDIISSSEFGSLYVDGDDIPEGKQVGDVKEVTDKVKGVAYSILYMKAVKALQEAMTRIETLEAKVTALENA